MDLEEVQVASYLRSHPAFIEEWLERNADLELFEAVKKKWSRGGTVKNEDRGEENPPPLLLPTSLKKALQASSLTPPPGTWPMSSLHLGQLFVYIF